MKFLRYWIPLLAYAGCIFMLSSIPGDGMPQLPFKGSLPDFLAEHFDKVVHFFLYACLGWLCLRLLVMGTRVSFLQAALFACMMTSVYGISDELHQYFVPNRSCDIWDWVADTFGGLFGILVVYRFYVRRSQQMISMIGRRPISILNHSSNIRSVS
jgi:hypothetical protein